MIYTLFKILKKELLGNHHQVLSRGLIFDVKHAYVEITVGFIRKT